MSVQIAIPEPTSFDTAYNQRSLPQYLAALHSAGATSIVVPLHERQDRVAKLLAHVQGILLPGSPADVDPQRYNEVPHPSIAAPDPQRNAVDELLLQETFGMHKPVLAICQGLQTLNVWCNGSLIQDLQTSVNHRPGRDVAEAHEIQIEAESLLAPLLGSDAQLRAQVNSSHHQAVHIAGDQLRVIAQAVGDGTIEAVERVSSQHFVLGVQWHPERTYTTSRFSRSIFAAFVQAAARWTPREIKDSVSAL